MARIELATYRSTSGCSATEPHPQRCERWGERRSNPRFPGFNRPLGPSQLPPHGVGVTYHLPADPERRRTESNRLASRVATCDPSHSVTAPRIPHHEHISSSSLTVLGIGPLAFSLVRPRVPNRTPPRGGRPPHALRHCASPPRAAPGFSRIALERIRASLLMLPTWKG